MPLKVNIGSAFPGVVDTPMQTLIRGLNVKDFPKVEVFKRLKEEGKLLDPTKVADCFYWLIRETNDEVFSQKDWDIEELMEMMESLT